MLCLIVKFGIANLLLKKHFVTFGASDTLVTKLIRFLWLFLLIKLRNETHISYRRLIDSYLN